MTSPLDSSRCLRCGTPHPPGQPCGAGPVAETLPARSTLDAGLGRTGDEPAEAPALVGQMVGEYEIREVLGQGGMGVVYGAVQPLIDKQVAIKVLHPALGPGLVGILIGGGF